MSQEDIYVLMLKEEGIPHSGKHGSDTTFFYSMCCSHQIQFSSNLISVQYINKNNSSYI